MKRIPEYNLSDIPSQDVPITVQNWLPYWQLEMVYDTSELSGFQNASKRDANEIERICNQILDFNELKSELLKFVKERRELIKDIDAKWNGDDCENWGFPRTILKPD